MRLAFYVDLNWLILSPSVNFLFLCVKVQQIKDTYGTFAELWRKWATANEQLDNHEHSNNNRPTRVWISPPCKKTYKQQLINLQLTLAVISETGNRKMERDWHNRTQVKTWKLSSSSWKQSFFLQTCESMLVHCCNNETGGFPAKYTFKISSTSSQGNSKYSVLTDSIVQDHNRNRFWGHLRKTVLTKKSSSPNEKYRKCITNSKENFETHQH